MVKKEYKNLEDLNHELAMMEGKPFPETLKKYNELYSYAKTYKLFPEQDLMKSLEHKIRVKRILNNCK